MSSFHHDDSTFELQPEGDAWALLRRTDDGQPHRIGTGLFRGLAAAEALAGARSLAQLANPVGVRIVPPDLAHTGNAGGLRLVPPDIAHPRYASWTGCSTSFPRDIHTDHSKEEGQHGHSR